MKITDSEIELKGINRPAVEILNLTIPDLRSRPVALLDVDHTLIYTDNKGRTLLNMALLFALKEKGINDLYLFTDMIFSAAQVKERLELIKALENQGFTVHGCITPADYFWDTDPAVLNNFDTTFCAANIVLREGSQKNLDRIPEIMTRFPSINARVKTELYPNIGGAFREAAESCLEADKMEELKLRSNSCKIAIDIVSSMKGLSSCKAIMMNQFLSNLLEWVSACYVFDDRIDNIKAIGEAIPSSIPIYVFHGDFSHRGETFVDSFLPGCVDKPLPIDLCKLSVPESTLESRMSDVVALAFEKIKSLQKGGLLGAYRFKKEFLQAESLFAKVIGVADDFAKQWECVLGHLKSLAKGFSGDYQLSVFDIQLLELISADSVICAKVDMLNNNRSKPIVFDLNQSVDRQQFIYRLLGDTAPAAEKKSGSKLNFSMGTFGKPRIQRASGFITPPPSSKKKSTSTQSPREEGLGVQRRERSYSEGPLPDRSFLLPSLDDSSPESSSKGGCSAIMPPKN